MSHRLTDEQIDRLAIDGAASVCDGRPYGELTEVEVEDKYRAMLRDLNACLYIRTMTGNEDIRGEDGLVAYYDPLQNRVRLFVEVASVEVRER